MTDPIARPAYKPFSSEDYEKPVPPRRDCSPAPRAEEAPWLTDPAFAPVMAYSAALLANPALRGSPAPADAPHDWPVLPRPASQRNIPAATGCARPIATAGNAHLFADRGIALGIALKDGVFSSASDLGRFIDEYVAHTSGRPELKSLHDDAVRTGPAILANRLDTEDAEVQRRNDEQQMQDRIAPLQLRAPLPIQQRAGVGEVAIPIARVATFAAKFVPMAGQLVVLAEVASGRSILGLGERLSNADRALEAALVIAPHAAKALGAGVRGAAEILRLSRATGRTADEIRVVCRASLEVARHRTAIREGMFVAKAGGAITSEQRAAMDAVGHSVDSLPDVQAVRGRMYKPTVTNDASLPAGQGWTDSYGNVGVSTQGSAKDIALAQAHESVHSFLSPKALNGLRDLRANVGMTAYDKSALCQYIEEALAETYAQVKVNGVRALPEGLTFPIRNGYVSLKAVAKEAAIGTIVYGGVLYAVHVTLNKK